MSDPLDQLRVRLDVLEDFVRSVVEMPAPEDQDVSPTALRFGAVQHMARRLLPDKEVD